MRSRRPEPAPDPRPPAERRAHLRVETSLLARFTVDGQSIYSGTVQSLSAGGVFLACQQHLPLGSAVRLEVGLGGELGLLRSDGIVVRHSRRSGTELVPGFGLRFEELEPEIVGELDAFVRAYPGPFTLSAAGEIHWPVEAHASAPPDAASCDLAIRGHGAAAVLEELVLALPPADDRPVALAAHGRPLAPPQAPSGRLLDLGLGAVVRASSALGERFPDELPAPQGAAEPAATLTLGWLAQAWAVGILERMEWRFVGATDELTAETAALERYATAVRERVAALMPRTGEAPHAERELLLEMGAALATLTRFLGRARSNLEAALCLVTGSAVTPGLGTAWLQEGPAIPSRPPPRRASPRRDRRVRILREITVRRLDGPRAAAAALVVALLFAGTYALVDYLRWRPPPEYGAYLDVAREGLSAVDRADRARLAERLDEARSLLGARRLDISSFAALETAEAALVFRHRVRNTMVGAPALAGRAWGDAQRYPSLDRFLLAQERDLIRGQKLLEGASMTLHQVLEQRRPYRADLDRTRAAAMRNHVEWLEQRSAQLERYR